MEKINKLMKELESEINKFETELNIQSSDKLLHCSYDYTSIRYVTRDEFIHLNLRDNDVNNDISISLSLKDALNLHEHIGKLIKNYLVYDLGLDEEDK